MNQKGFASIYMVYSFFLLFITMMLAVLMVNTYKKNFLNHLKNDIKTTLVEYKLEQPPEILEEEEQNLVETPKIT